ncbi:MAG: DUF1624 domain-containing protein [Candidatus Kapabacteria bacterium]|nr:DUF1624 domain-containing protein [Candidatus Kapabacteria bacterium]MCS7169110.1 DUF1624 domain-containing protein [Candidatus Kapabacteria bacterium]MDW7997572.1 heparan-alpha-glucosaminide N-acetyltransferase domain-containing protein [Bacteroidota bacterium]MDW8225984.1 heparan-alpha-glucosaminide N-acetyltransferase domain-containing protein [Bacteroidota bacterium]
MPSSERLYALDAVRIVAMLLMVQGHTLDALVSPAQLDITLPPWNIWHFVRGLTAPVFLIVSGIVYVFATHRTPEGRVPEALIWRRLRWALMLIAIGYLMTFPAQRLWHIGYVPAEQWTVFFRVHILQLIGIALLIVLLLFLLTRTQHQLGMAGLLVGAMIVCSAPVSAWVDWYQALPEPLAAYMSTDRGSLFPFVPFAAYLFLGLPLGSWLRHLPAERRLKFLRLHLLWLGLMILSIAPLLTIWCQALLPPQANPYHANPGLILLRFGLALLLISAVAWVYRLMEHWGPLFALFSRYALFVFVGHLAVLYGTPWFSSIAHWYPKALSLSEGIGIAVGVSAVCLIGVLAIETARRSQWGWTILRAGAATAIAYFLFAP